MSKWMAAKQNQECRVIIPVSKKVMAAVGVEEGRIYLARLEDGLIIIEEHLENPFHWRRAVGYKNGECGVDCDYDCDHCRMNSK